MLYSIVLCQNILNQFVMKKQLSQGCINVGNQTRWAVYRKSKRHHTFLTLILIQCKNYYALANAHHIVGLLATARGPSDFDMSHHTSMAQIIGLTGSITLWSPSDCTSFKKGNENV